MTKKHSNGYFPPREECTNFCVEETTGMPSYYMDEDYPVGPEIQ